MKKKLFFAFGPVLIAFLIVACIFLTPSKTTIKNEQLIEVASSSLSTSVVQGTTFTNSALTSDQYLPIFGSSELKRFSAFHPSVLAYKYDRPYTPFLIGEAGTQSLTHFSIMNSNEQQLKNKKMVFILSPQWFVPKGMKDDYFEAHFSKLQLYNWLTSTQHVTTYDQYYANRLLQFKNIENSSKLTSLLEQVASGQALSKKQKNSLKLERQLLDKEDQLFGSITTMFDSNLDKIHAYEKQLPNKEDSNEWVKIADEIGAKHTSNNDLGIINSFYNKNLRGHLKSLKGKQTDWDYTKGPEFADFQLVLQQMAKQQSDVLFIIPPINEKWTNYTGLSQEMIQVYARKITQQLQNQGFENIADYTTHAAEPYFMQDTIHLGWKGWINVDHSIQNFLKNDETPNYHLDDYYLTEEWQQS